MNILIACEYSGIVRDAFLNKGHNAWSCDLLPTESDGPHYQGDVRDILLGSNEILRKYASWDMIIAFPPCTHIATSGARWFPEKIADGRQQAGIEFFMLLIRARLYCPRVAIENPIGIMSTHYRKPDQIIQPWQFGHGETKATCLWLSGLGPLEPTNIVSGREQRIWKLPPGPDRAKLRSKTYPGIASAMADQWGR